jgi:ribose transport system substrate-binding protein
MILKNLTNPFFISIKEGGEAAAKELGIKLTVLAPLQADSNEEQSNMVEQSIVNRTDLVILCPADSEGIVPAARKLQQAGIPVVDLNTKIGGKETLARTFVATENYNVGYQTMKRLLEMAGGKGEVFIIEGVSGAQTSIDRTRGAMDAAATFPEVHIVARQSADYNRAKAMNVVQNLLQAHPNVRAIFNGNDEMALGAVEAVNAAGKSGKILISGADANADARQAILDGKMALTCDQQPYMQGYMAVKTAARVLRGEKVEPFQKIDIKLISKADLEKNAK